MSDTTSFKETLRKKILDEGFDACGFCDTSQLNSEKNHLQHWLNQGFNGSMHYMENHFEKRLSPEILVPQAKTVIITARNYFPKKSLPNHSFSISKYAYGEDYHKVIKDKLHHIVTNTPELKNDSNLRIFVDSAPLLERALAVKAGLGFIGKNSCLIIPHKGSFFFLGEIVTTLELPPDPPFTQSFCGNCTRCMDACPTQSFIEPKILDARKCNSYLTIECQETNPKNQLRGNYFFGCDVCQDVCPHNRFSQPHRTAEFDPIQELTSIKPIDWDQLTLEQFNKIFKNSPLKRAGLEKLKRNSNLLKE